MMKNQKSKIKNQNNQYVIVLGRVPELSLSELQAVFKRNHIQTDITKLTTNLALVKTDFNLDQKWFECLGGCLKLGRILLISDDINSPVECLKENINTRTIGLSILSSQLKTKELANGLKKLLKLKRYVLAPRREILSSAQSKGIRRRGQEFLIFEHNRRFYIAEIVAVQNIDDFTRRDRGLPAADPKRGMLPTKIARIMVNLAIGLVPNIAKPVIVDPFCGTGRILMEALLTHNDILGSDIDQKAIDETIANLLWTTEQYNLKAQDFTQLVRCADIKDIDSVFGDFAADLIVTEPLLGPPQHHKPDMATVEQIIRGITPFYLTLFERGKDFLRFPAGMVVIFPNFDHISLLDRLVDKIIPMGYHMTNKFKVARPDQFISREIGVFNKIK